MSERPSNQYLQKTAFVTVGSTLFDALIRAVDDLSFQNELLARGFTSLTIQIGKGNYLPEEKNGGNGRLKVEYFRFNPSLSEYMRKACLIISHAGSGSIFEALRAGKQLIVAVNELLMDNHQLELAAALAEKGYLFYGYPSTLSKVFKEADFSVLVPYPEPEVHKFAKSLDTFLGFG